MSVRVFGPPGERLRAGARLELEREEAHYLLRVRRARPGDAIELLDGIGGRWHAHVLEDGEHARVELGDPIATPGPAREVVLLLAPPDPKAALDALAAACAGGASEVVFVETARSQAALPGDERMARVMRATMRQCGRPSPPPLRGPLPLEEALALRPELPGVLAHAQSEPTSPPGGPGLRLLVGPEGGLTDEELERARAAGFVPMSLGPWTLRTEAAVTAGLCRLLTAQTPRGSLPA